MWSPGAGKKSYKKLNVKNLSVYNTVLERWSHTSRTAHIIFFWDNVIARSHIALTIHLTWPLLTFALPHYHASKGTSKEKNANAIMSNKLLLFIGVCACNPVARITYTVLVETLNHAQSKRACNLQCYWLTMKRHVHRGHIKWIVSAIIWNRAITLSQKNDLCYFGCVTSSLLHGVVNW